MSRNPRCLLISLLASTGCIELGDIKITIVDDTAGDTELNIDSGPVPDSTPPVTDDSAGGDSAGGDSGSGEDTSATETPEREVPTTFTGPPLGDDVLIYQGDGSLPVDSGEYLINGVDKLSDLYSSLGGDVVISDTWPADAGAYKLAFWYLPGSAKDAGYAIPEETVDAILDWLGRGGRLVIAGDVNGSYLGYSLSQGNLTIDSFLTDVGADIRIEETYDDPVVCEGVSDHALMQNGATVDSYLGNSLQIEGSAMWLYCDGIAVQNIWCGEIVVSGDVNPVSDSPNLAPEFVQNLYNVPVESTCH